MFKPLSNQARRLWTIFGTVRTWFSTLGKATERKLQREEQEIIFEEQKLKKENAKVYVYEQLQKRKRDLERQKEEFYSFKNLIDNLPKNKSPNFYYNALVDILARMGRTEETIEVGKIYTFKYIGITQGKWYDVHPVSLITSKENNYYKGVNYHWQRRPEYIESPIRTYNYSRIQSMFYRIKPQELEYVLRVPSFYPVLISKR
jgi:predicted ATP-dependent protease